MLKFKARSLNEWEKDILYQALSSLIGRKSTFHGESDLFYPEVVRRSAQIIRDEMLNELLWVSENKPDIQDQELKGSASNGV